MAARPAQAVERVEATARGAGWWRLGRGHVRTVGHEAERRRRTLRADAERRQGSCAAGRYPYPATLRVHPSHLPKGPIQGVSNPARARARAVRRTCRGHGLIATAAAARAATTARSRPPSTARRRPRRRSRPGGHGVGDLAEDALGRPALEADALSTSTQVLDGDALALAVDGHLMGLQPAVGGIAGPGHVVGRRQRPAAGAIHQERDVLDVVVLVARDDVEHHPAKELLDLRLSMPSGASGASPGRSRRRRASCS